MALVDTTWYANSVGYAAVTARPQNTAVAAGVVRRQFTAPAVGSERVFVCIVAGTTANVTDATWVLTRGAKTTDGTVTWMECTGQAALNGDLTNTATWAQVKAATPAVLGQIIKRSSNASYQICTTAGAMSASEPSFSDTAGVTTTDTTAVWTSLGPVSNFTGGQAPFARLQSAVAATWFAAGNTIYVGNNHAETQASAMSFGPAGSASTVNKILCHDLGSYPPAAANLTTGATVTTTSGNLNLNATVALSTTYYRGLVFTAATGANLIVSISSGTILSCENCSFEISGGTGLIILGSGAASPSVVNWNNCTVRFGAAGGAIFLAGAQFVWRNTGPILVSGSSVPNNLFGGTGNPASPFVGVLEALDLGQLTGTLFTNASIVVNGSLLVTDCKLNASLSPPTISSSSGMIVRYVRCDSGATNYKAASYQYEGTQTVETSITRVGGATDGTTASSNKAVTTANAQFLRPFNVMPLAIWNDTTAADVTVTVYGTVNSASLPTNEEIWMDVEYLGSSATPVGTIKTTAKANVLATAASVNSDSSTWNGGGSGGGWSPFKLVATLTSPQPQMKGFIYINVRAAKASSTYYLDPLPTLS